MSSKRIQLSEMRLAAVEAAYRSVLVAALEDCAAGRWGLFGQNEHIPAHSRFRPKALDELDALATDINELRQKLGYGVYPLHYPVHWHAWPTR